MKKKRTQANKQIKMSEELFKRGKERPPQYKAFVRQPDEISGFSATEPYRNDAKLSELERATDMCLKYAQSYSHTFAHRLLAEEPDFFEEKGVSKETFLARMESNICMNIMQYKNKVYREFEANLHDKLETTQEMRRLANGGDKFHPYL